MESFWNENMVRTNSQGYGVDEIVENPEWVASRGLKPLQKSLK